MFVTRVRFNDTQGQEALDKYIFGGHYGPLRVPRGLPPTIVSRFLNEKVGTEADSDDLRKALEVMRYYEAVDTVPHFQKLMGGSVEDVEGFKRESVFCQMMGDLGSASDAEDAAGHFNRHLARLPEAITLSAITLETLLVLAPAGALETFETRVTEEQSRLAPAQRKDEPSMMAYDKVAAIGRNQIPRTRRCIEVKKKLVQEKPAERRHPLVELYLGRAKVNDPYLQVWAARQLRREAMTVDPAPVQKEFRQVLDETPKDALGADPRTDATFMRAARALDYFQTPLTQADRADMGKVKTSLQDFLDDEDA